MILRCEKLYTKTISQGITDSYQKKFLTWRKEWPMMELKNVQTAEEYLIYYEEAIEWDQVVKLFPKTYALYQTLGDQFRKEYRQASKQLFHSLRKLLEIDAQLQILVQLFQREQDWSFMMADEELVEMIIRDKKSFYRENAGLRTNDQAPWGLMYLSEQNECSC